MAAPTFWNTRSRRISRWSKPGVATGLGNLVYRKTAQNFNPMMAAAAKITIAEVEELVEPGAIDADHVRTPGIYVQRIVQGEKYDKTIERRTVRAANGPA